MAGFAGFLNYVYRRENTELVLKNMTEKLIRRGSDIEAYYDDRYTHIGYRCREVKNITSKKKSMTLKKDESEYIMVFDGELYNKEELLALFDENNFLEDEEIILNLYHRFGEKFVEKVKGVFAFAIWNVKEKTLYMARDSLGVKPLYYAKVESNFVFASEIKAILEFPEVHATITNYGIANLFLNGVLEMEKEIFFKDIEEVKAGEYIVHSESETRVEKYMSNTIENFSVETINLVNENVELTENEIRNIVKTKDVPSNLGFDAMLIKECEKGKENLKIKDLKPRIWCDKIEVREMMILPKLKIDLREFYEFQKRKEKNIINFTSVDMISSRFGYNILLPNGKCSLNVECLRKILQDILLYIDSPILDIIDRNKTLKILYELDVDTIIYLIEINIWLEEYRVRIK